MAAVQKQTRGVVEADRTVRVSCAQSSADVRRELFTVPGVATSAAADAVWAIEAEAGEVRHILPDGAVLVLDATDVNPEHVDESLSGTRPLIAKAILTVPLDDAPGSSVASDAGSADASGSRGRPWCEVQVLGGVHVLLDGEELWLSPQQRELLAYLACHGGAGAKQTGGSSPDFERNVVKAVRRRWPLSSARPAQVVSSTHGRDFECASLTLLEQHIRVSDTHTKNRIDEAAMDMSAETALSNTEATHSHGLFAAIRPPNV